MVCIIARQENTFHLQTCWCCHQHFVIKIDHQNRSPKCTNEKILSGSYTLFTVGDNFHKFFVVVPTSIITETDLRDSLQMPNIYVCLNSQHSKAYMNMKYSSWPTLEHYLGIWFSKMLSNRKSWRVGKNNESKTNIKGCCTVISSKQNTKKTNSWHLHSIQSIWLSFFIILRHLWSF